MAKLLNILLLLGFIGFSQAQQILVEGKTTNTKGEHLPFVAIVLKASGKGTISNESGGFRIFVSSENDTLLFSCLGYELKQIPLKGLKLQQKLWVELEIKNVQLPVFTLIPPDPVEMLRKVLAKLPENLPPAPFHYDAFYRQYHMEDGKAARLIECALDIADPGLSSINDNNIRELVRIGQIRRSNVYERNGDTHDNHLNDLFLQNMAYYPLGSVLNPKGWTYYKFRHFYPEDNQQGIHAIIAYAYENSRDLRLDFGKLYIDTSNFSIVKVEQESIINANYISGTFGGSNRWNYLKGYLNISYRNIRGHMYPDSICFYYKHNVISEKLKNRVFTVEEYFDLFAGDVYLQKASGKDYKNYHNLYTKSYTYNEDFWKEYPLLLQHPLNPAFQEEMERTEFLNEQFRKNLRGRGF